MTVANVQFLKGFDSTRSLSTNTAPKALPRKTTFEGRRIAEVDRARQAGQMSVGTTLAISDAIIAWNPGSLLSM